jgi:Erythromycin esterase
MIKSNKKITIFIEDTIEHTQNIMTDKKLFIDNEYGLTEEGWPYGPLWKYCIMSWDSPIYLKIIQYIRQHKNRINIIGVDYRKILYRDKHMTKNILENLNRDHINFVWMDNVHVDARNITENPKDKHRCGYYLKKMFGSKYLIILTTGFKGVVRFSSTCHNVECKPRIFLLKPIFERLLEYEPYQKYQTNNPFDIYAKGKFNDKLVEYSDAKFVDANIYMPHMVESKTWNYLVFFSSVQKLDLI